MPIIYEYLGILIGFYTNDHEPIHIHAKYGDAIVKVVLHRKDNHVYRTTYHPIHGKFPVAKIKTLKKFISTHKEALVYAWEQVFIHGTTVQRIIINKKI